VKKFSLVVRAEADEIAGLVQALLKVSEAIAHGKGDGWDNQAAYMFYVTPKGAENGKDA